MSRVEKLARSAQPRTDRSGNPACASFAQRRRYDVFGYLRSATYKFRHAPLPAWGTPAVSAYLKRPPNVSVRRASGGPGLSLSSGQSMAKSIRLYATCRREGLTAVLTPCL